MAVNVLIVPAALQIYQYCEIKIGPTGIVKIKM